MTRMQTVRWRGFAPIVMAAVAAWPSRAAWSSDAAIGQKVSPADPAVDERADAPVVADDLTIPKETRLDGLSARVRVRDHAAGFEVGRPITFAIEFEGAGAASVSIPPIETIGEFDVLSISVPPAATGVSVELVLSTLASGTIEPGTLPVRWVHDGAERSGAVALPSLSVASLLGEQIDPSQFRDIAGEIVLVLSLIHI